MSVEVIELTAAEGRELFDKAARRRLGISGDEFLRRLDAGEYPACGCHPHAVFELRMLESFGRATPHSPDSQAERPAH